MTSWDTRSDRVYRVVVADDVADLRFLLGRALQTSGRFEVVGSAANGREAVAVATEQRPDLTLLDLTMPVMDGLEALPLIREAVPEGTVVVLSGLDGDDIIATARARGAAGYLVKGISPQRLVDDLLFLLQAAEAVAPVDGPTAADVITEMARAHIDLPADPRSGGQARGFVTRCLADWQLQSLSDTALLLTTELVTNAILHARSAVGLTVRRTPDRLRVEVADTGAGALVLRDADTDSTGGRGLQLMEALAHAWGTSAQETGKLVWFELEAGRL